MKRALLLLCAAVFLTFSALPAITAETRPVPARRLAFESNSSSDIWVYNGAWCYWDGSEYDSASFLANGSTPDKLLETFIENSGFRKNARKISSEYPLRGLTASQSVFVLDSTPLYLESSALHGIYGFSSLNITSGSFTAEILRAVSGIFIGNGSNIRVLGEIYTGGTFESFGAFISAGEIYARKIWLDSSQAPLSLTVTGGVFAGFYTQCGGNVKIGGGLFTSADNIDGFSALTVNNDFALYNTSILNVSGDIVSSGGGGRIEIGGGTAFGLFDEASLTSYICLRSDTKYRDLSLYAKNPIGKPLASNKISVTAGGNILATRSITFYSGSTATGGIINTYTPTGTVRVYGGTVSQGI